MQIDNSNPPELYKHSTLKNGLSLIALMGSLVVLVMAFIQAQAWFGQPNCDIYLTPQLTLAPAQDSIVGGLKPGDQLIMVEGEIVQTLSDLLLIMQTKQPGDAVVFEFKVGSGETVSVLHSIKQTSARQQLYFFYVPFFVGFIYWLVGFWSFLYQRNKPFVHLMIFYNVFSAIVISCNFNVFTSQQLFGVWILSMLLLGLTLLVFMMQYPKPDIWFEKNPWVRYVIYLSGVLVVLLEILFGERLYLVDHLRWFALIMILGALGWSGFRQLSTKGHQRRGHILIIVLSGLVSYLPFTVLRFLQAVNMSFAPGIFGQLFYLPMAVFPLSLALLNREEQEIRISKVLKKSLVYLLLAGGIIVGYALIITGVTLVFSEDLADSPWLQGLFIFLVALLLLPLRDRLSQFLDRTFFKGTKIFEEEVQDFAVRLRSMTDINQILDDMAETIQRIFSPESIYLFMYDTFSKQYLAINRHTGYLQTDLRFSISSDLVRWLDREHTYLDVVNQGSIIEGMKGDAPRLFLLDSRFVVPLINKDSLIGFLCLGPKSGEPYRLDDGYFLQALCQQAALAQNRADFIQHLEGRVKELDVLTRISQGINITVGLNDILELVYAQTALIIPLRQFQILLNGSYSEEKFWLFYVENDERLTEIENRPLSGERFLEDIVFEQRKALLTSDDLETARINEIPIRREKSRVWMGVPLNSGADTIGTLSIATDEPGTSYTQDQLQLLQSIADQAAGAIVKDRLLVETERRAHQLMVLNDMSQLMASTLELEPLLMKIIERSVELLNCEAGSLLLLDEHTNELVFRVVVGEAADQLINRRMPSDEGIVGRAFQTRLPVIVNNVRVSDDWYPDSDQDTGFRTNSLLAVPLTIKNRSIGAIEVVNKAESGLFDRKDQELLTGLAGQAAVSIENARLYTMTDRALAEKVEELSVMQRIDRELNTSLDTESAMRITLTWAIRQSGSAAGFIGLADLQEHVLRIIAHEGYDWDSGEDGKVLPFDQLALSIPLHDLNSVSRKLNGDDGFLADARQQVLVPIVRQEALMGIFLLESPKDEPISEAMLNFLDRLSDHAAIAIANAQLYETVQGANVAKSEFVSFVAHELKNPMTSIKGYTELLAAGAVGQVNDAQSNFLQTIRSNVERMATLVSDLSDVSRIEAGRLRLEFKAVDLNGAVDEVMRSMARQIEDKNQNAALQIPEDLPKVWADRTRLVQIILNLVSNASKYTGNSGDIIISAEAVTNIWDQTGAERVVHFQVKDNGIGLQPEDQERIFQKFFRSEDPKTREAPGTGLGLNITKSLVENMGGTIWFASEFRKGTTFHVTLPVSEVAE
jgi:signal transduction histidine kinase